MQQRFWPNIFTLTWVILTLVKKWKRNLPGNVGFQYLRLVLSWHIVQFSITIGFRSFFFLFIPPPGFLLQQQDPHPSPFSSLRWLEWLWLVVVFFTVVLYVKWKVPVLKKTVQQSVSIFVFGILRNFPSGHNRSRFFVFLFFLFSLLLI